MKILIVSFYYPPEMGAAPSRIFNMAGGLCSEGAKVEVLTCLPNYPKGRIFEGYRRCFSKSERIDGIGVKRYWTYATVSRNPMLRLLGMTLFSANIWLYALKPRRVCSYDRVIIQSPPLLVAFSATLLFRCLYRRKTVLNVSDLWPTSAVELGAVKEGSPYYKVLAWMERFVYKHNSAWQGQSAEIIGHIASFGHNTPHFLYRNLQPQTQEPTAGDALKDRRGCFRLVYAGLLGVAQDILNMVKNINFKDMGAELHIYGGGIQAEEIKAFVASHDCGAFFHGYKTKEEITRILGTFHASIVPLAVSIKGAVPSKIFDLLPHGTPMLFCGGGEGESIIRQYNIGLVSEPGNYEMLRENIQKLALLSDAEYCALRENCIRASLSDFSFSEQMERYYRFLQDI